jgi:hypothetical protein
MPNHIEKSKDNSTFQFNERTVINSSLPGNSFILQELTRIMEKHMQLSPAVDNKRNKNRIEIEVDSTLKEKEHYTLEVDKRGISIKGGSQGALFMALQTLDQILIGDFCNTADKKVEHIRIDDKPRFAHRAVMIDPARHFLPVKDVKFFIDQMARFKYNVLQLHLTDDQGWRIEIKSHPKLTEIGAFRNNGKTPSPDNGYYTHEDIKEIIAYAAERNIEVIPELDIPGHSQYFMTIFGVQMESEKGMKILDKLFEEFLAEIPAEDCPYIHIGSDEVRRKMPDPEGFVKHYEDILTRDGRKALVWSPGIKPSPSTICQIWGEGSVEDLAEGEERNPYLDSYMGYLNHGNLITNIHTNFLHQMCAVDKADAYAMGGILCLWNDVKQASPEQIFPINGMPIAMLPFAERSWAGGSGYSNEDLVAFEGKMAYHRDNFLRDWDIRWVTNAHIPWKVSIPAGMNSRMEDAEWTTAWGGSVNLYKIGQEKGVKFEEKMKAWLKTEIYSGQEREICAWVSFETPSRSTRRSAGIGEQGQWETGGKIFVNGEEVLPPSPWKEPGMYSYHFSTYGYPDIQNLPWTDEQLFWMREPAKIKLRKGWNTILMEAPLHYSTPFWFVSFTPVEIGEDGRLTEVKNLEYR